MEAGDADGLTQLLSFYTDATPPPGEHEALAAYAGLRAAAPWPAATELDVAIDFAAAWSARNPIAADALSHFDLAQHSLFGTGDGAPARAAQSRCERLFQSGPS